jgi:hypothetical protein
MLKNSAGWISFHFGNTVEEAVFGDASVGVDDEDIVADPDVP